jgi:hypothetical protein
VKRSWVSIGRLSSGTEEDGLGADLNSIVT